MTQRERLWRQSHAGRLSGFARAAGWGVMLAVCAYNAPAQVTRPSSITSQIDYSTPPSDAIARLQRQLDAKALLLEYDAKRGYLPSVLEALDVPMSSQSLVFSRTSLQVDRIAPWTPRALYFNQDVYVGWVQNGPVLEIASVDPNMGAVFYTLRQDSSLPPEFERQTDTCLMCHESDAVTGGIPGFIMRSIVPDRYGYPISTVHDGSSTDRTPFSSRWGGWYATGTYSGEHSGNTLSPKLLQEIGSVSHYMTQFDMKTDGTVTDLSERFDTSAYLTPHSDIVALVVLAHQVNVHNLITRANYESREAMRDEELLNPLAATEGYSPITLSRITRSVERLLRGMLFVNEASMAEAMTGSSSFAVDFAATGPKDSEGRSLREFDLETRLFRYPLSFLIYSESFDTLPEIVRTQIGQRLEAVLTGSDLSDEFNHLDVPTRQAILSIVRDTKPDLLPRSWGN